MFAIAFDMIVADIRSTIRRASSQAYADIGTDAAPFGFERVQGSVYLTAIRIWRSVRCDLASGAAWFALRARHPRLQGRELVGFHADREATIMRHWHRASV